MNPTSVELLLSPLLFSCCGEPDIRIQRTVTESEIVGVWELDPQSSALAADHDGDDYDVDPSQQHLIEFRADGTWRYRSVLQMPTRHIDAAGSWSMVAPSDAPRGSRIEIGLQMDDGGTYLFSLDIREESGELVLREFWDDPDPWIFLDYQRKDTGQDGAGPPAARTDSRSPSQRTQLLALL